MNPAIKKRLIAAILMIALLGIGFAWGYAKGVQVGLNVVEFTSSMGYMSYLGLQTQNAYYQYKTADYDVAHSALLGLTDVLKNGLSGKNKDAIIDDRLLYVDLGVTYARLALLEKSKGNNNAMEDYFKQSMSAFKSAWHKEYDRDKIIEFVTILDKHEPL